MSDPRRPTPVAPAAPRLTEEEAQAVWRRAAELHLAATRAPAAGADPLAPASSHGSLVTLDAVREAAQGAGIAPEYVERALADALADRRSETPPPDPDPRTAGERRLSRLLLGATPEFVEVRRVAPAGASETLAATGATLTAPPFALRRPRLLGGTPGVDATLALDIPLDDELRRTYDKRDRAVVEESWKPLRDDLHVRAVRVAVRALPGAPDRSELVASVDLRPGLAHTAGAMGLAIAASAALAAFVLGGLIAILLHEAGEMPAIAAAPLGMSLGIVLTLIAGVVATRLLSVGAASQATQALARAADAVLARVSEEALARGGWHAAALPGAEREEPDMAEEPEPAPR